MLQHGGYPGWLPSPGDAGTATHDLLSRHEAIQTNSRWSQVGLISTCSTERTNIHTHISNRTDAATARIRTPLTGMVHPTSPLPEEYNCFNCRDKLFIHRLIPGQLSSAAAVTRLGAPTDYVGAAPAPVGRHNFCVPTPSTRDSRWPSRRQTRPQRSWPSWH